MEMFGLTIGVIEMVFGNIELLMLLLLVLAVVRSTATC